MQELKAFVKRLDLAIEITGIDERTYRCEKCSNKKGVDVDHPITKFVVVDDNAWSVPRRSQPFIYMLTAVRAGDQLEAPRYVGIGEDFPSLMRRWTRLPGSLKSIHPDGSLIHHMPATIPRLSRDFLDADFRSMGGYFRLYGATAQNMVKALQAGHAASASGWPLDVLPPPSAGLYLAAEAIEEAVVRRMYAIGLGPWNETRGPTARLSSQVLSEDLGFSIAHDQRARMRAAAF